MSEHVYNKDNKSTWKGEISMEFTTSAREAERLFIAVTLPKNLSELLKKACAEWSGEMKFAKWTHSEDYHITLQFLGDVSRKDIPELLKALKVITGKCEPFTLRLENIGTFGSPHAPRVLFAGISGDLAKLADLQQHVVSATSAVGFTAETREYHPHITLARKYRDKQPFSARELLLPIGQKEQRGNACSEKDWTVDAFVVYATKMHAIPMYEMIEKVTFI